jgi:hypothetical protein
MNASRILLTTAGLTTAAFILSIAFGFASTASLAFSVLAWMALGVCNAYAPRAQLRLPRSRTGMRAVAACCPKSSLRLAA